jgi:hypothetical protein
MPTTDFDPAGGVLRLAHGDLSVLAMLAADPVDPRLHDHDVAPHVATLRRCGILGRAGFHTEIRPLTDAIAAARGELALSVVDRGEAQRCHGWVSPGLVVIAVPGAEDPQSFDLVADHPSAVADLVDDLVGLGTAPRDAGADAATAAAVAEAHGRRWRFSVGNGGTGSAGVLAVLDAGAAGLWRESPDPDDAEEVQLEPTDAETIRTGITAMVTALLAS